MRIHASPGMGWLMVPLKVVTKWRMALIEWRWSASSSMQVSGLGWWNSRASRLTWMGGGGGGGGGSRAGWLGPARASRVVCVGGEGGEEERFCMGEG